MNVIQNFNSDLIAEINRLQKDHEAFTEIYHIINENNLIRKSNVDFTYELNDNEKADIEHFSKNFTGFVNRFITTRNCCKNLSQYIHFICFGKQIQLLGDEYIELEFTDNEKAKDFVASFFNLYQLIPFHLQNGYIGEYNIDGGVLLKFDDNKSIKITIGK